MNPAVLVIENDRATRKLLDVLLRRFGIAVDLVATGSDALLLLEHVEYDLVFVDFLQTGGIDVLEWIGINRPSMVERCIVLSSSAPSQLERVRERWPGVRTIRKPFELADIVEAAEATAAAPARRNGAPVESFTRRSVSAGAKAGVVVTLDGEQLVPSMWFGYPPGVVESFGPMRIDSPLPIANALRDARPVWLASLAGVTDEYPQLRPLWEKLESRALAAVPLMRDGAPVGAAGWTFREARLFHEPEQQLFRSIAEEVAAQVEEIGST
jgi:CheY-like chemotaxis protein